MTSNPASDLASSSASSPTNTQDRVLSCLQPTGEITLGNYVGAISHWVNDQGPNCFYGVVDLHAITIPREPSELREKTLATARLLIAAGIDPDRTTIFLQSHVPAHAQLGWLMQCIAGFGELSRMTQFKDKAEKQRNKSQAADALAVGEPSDANQAATDSRVVQHTNESISSALFSYPTLMAADILLYDADRVPVGDDQRQHLELARDIAMRFNARYGETFVVPNAAIPKIGARIMDLQNPTNKMSKSADSPAGTICVLDDPDVLSKKVKRSVTDTLGEVNYDPVNQPGVSNLLSILAVCTNTTPELVAQSYTQYGPLKNDTAAAVIEYLTPIRTRYNELANDNAYLTDALSKGAHKAEAVADKVLKRAFDAMGFVPRS